MIGEDEDDEHPQTQPITIQQEHEWLVKQDLSKYKGEWIAVFAMEIIAHAPSLADVVKLVKNRLPSDMLPLYMRIPEGFITCSSCLDCFLNNAESNCAVCGVKTQ